MFEFYLPYAASFEKLLLNNEICDWEAKMFIKFINGMNGEKLTTCPTYIYGALKILIRHNFLNTKRSKSNNRLFLYSETEKLKYLRNCLLNDSLKNIIDVEKELITNTLDNYKLQKEYLCELVLKYPEIDSEIINLDQKIEFEKLKNIQRLNMLAHFLGMINK